MCELLQRVTGMKVMQVKDRTRVRPDCVYVIPPNKDMSILHGVLHLLSPAAPRGLRLPIDFFLCSLARDQQERSIGVILSGMGSDGTLGLRAIKEKAGSCWCRSLRRPNSTACLAARIDAGLADMVAPVDELPGKIITYLRRTPLLARPELALEDKTQSAMDKAVILLRAHTGHDFSCTRGTPSTAGSSVAWASTRLTRLPTISGYLHENSQELDLLFKELLIGVTSFFRDPAAWEHMHEKAIPELIAGRSSPTRPCGRGCPAAPQGRRPIPWPSCSRRQWSRSPKGSLPCQLFATDLDRDAIDKARQGVFPDNIVADVSPERMSRFFSKKNTATGCTKRSGRR